MPNEGTVKAIQSDRVLRTNIQQLIFLKHIIIQFAMEGLREKRKVRLKKSRSFPVNLK